MGSAVEKLAWNTSALPGSPLALSVYRQPQGAAQTAALASGLATIRRLLDNNPRRVQVLSVMLVEDNDCIRSSTADMLRDMGHSVLEAGSAEQAMPLMHRLPIDVLVADIGLPGMSGDVFAAEARSIQPLIGIVFATGGGGLARAPSASPGPVLLRKPYDFDALAKALDAATPGLAR